MSGVQEVARWSAIDEQELQRLQKRKARFETENLAPLTRWVRNYFDESYAETYANTLRVHAASVRKLLEPFDDGDLAALEQER